MNVCVRGVSTALACAALWNNVDSEFKGKLVKLPSAPGSQHSVRRAIHDVGSQITVGTTTFAVRTDGPKLFVAARATDPATVEAKDGKDVALAIGERADARKVKLRFVRGEDGAWRWYVPEAREFELAAVTIRIYDLDGDGLFTVDADGWSAYDAEMVCPLEPELVIGRYQVSLRSIAPDGSRITAEVAEIKGTPSQLSALECLNRARAQNGLAPVVLDPNLSRACTSHAEYLRANGWTGYTNPHSEPSGTPGASDEGDRAARSSVIMNAEPGVAVDGFWRTYYHRASMMAPGLRRIGINATPADLAVIDTINGIDEKWGNDCMNPTTVPGDGGVAFPPQSTVELPDNPVPDFGDRGGALMAVFKRDATSITDFRVELERLDKGKRVPLATLPAAQGIYRHVFGAVPEQPLDSDTRYRATFTWKTPAGAESRVVTFRTE